MKLVLVFAMLCAVGAASAQPAESFTLQQALNAAFSNNPAIQSALSTAEAAADRANVQRGTLLPEAHIEGRAGSKHQAEFPNQRIQHLHSEHLVITQPLTLTQEYADWQAEKANSDAQLAKAQDIIQRTLLDTATAYADLLVAQETISATTTLARNLEGEDTGTRRQFEEGEGTRTAVAQVRSRLADARADKARALAQRDAALAQLQSLTATLVRADTVTWPDAPTVKPIPEKEATENHPVVKEAEAQLTQQDYRKKSAGSEILPELSLNASRGRDYGDPDTNQAWASEVTVNYSIPLFRGGRTVYGIKAARSDYAAAAQQLQSARYQVRSEWISAMSALDASRDNFEQAKAGFGQQQIAITGARLEYDNGERTLTDLLNAEQEYIQSDINLHRARHDLIVNSYRLRAAQGGLSIP